ncbi:MAG: hypothetical protein E4H01_05375 [Lysobacterales bacterium]|nr:MAG: hypothetical protein E4H01_05375 [Xanthomonadales bacterium]
MDEQYVWIVWAGAFLLPWAVLWAAFPAHRRTMLWASIFTAPFGLTEPLFVPEYWSPPSLFDLALRTGFDIESLVFCFGIGGVAAVIYNVLTGTNLEPLSEQERRLPLHKHHYKALAAPFVVFPLLYLLPVNPIYPGIAAMIVGTVTTILCRPDLKTKTWVGGVVFTIYYAAFVLGLEWLSPGYVQRVWNLDALSGLLMGPVPFEELAFAAVFGMYWSGVYDHFSWRRLVSELKRDTVRPASEQ